MNKTILVTGGAGYIGSHTAWLLAKQGYRVIILDTFVHNQLCTAPWATVIRGNYGDSAQLTTLFQYYTIDAVMHFGASVEVGISEKEPAAFYHNNVAHTITLLNSMHKHYIPHFIFSSSCAVYGTPEHLPLTEEHPQRPVNVYGHTKQIVESMLEQLAQRTPLSYVALRYFNAGGALPEHKLGEQHNPETHIIPLLLRAAHTGTPFSIFGTDYNTPDGTCIRDYLHVRDIAQAHIQALQHLQSSKTSDVFNIGTGHGYSVKKMIKQVEQETQKTVTTIEAERRAGDPAVLVANRDKAETVLGWKPQYSSLEAIVHDANQFMLHTIATNHRSPTQHTQPQR